MSAAFWIEHGTQFPYADGYVAKDASDRAALAVLANLGDRRGIKQELQVVDEDVRAEIVSTLADIIRAATGEAA